MTFADHLEQRATSLDAPAEVLCKTCGHAIEFHLSFDMREPVPCDFEVRQNTRIYSNNSKLCGCAVFNPPDVEPYREDE
jgi:hypothetical protein